MRFLILLCCCFTSAFASPGLDAVSQGDRHHYAGERKQARTAYRQAIDSAEPAAEAMARLRLLRYAGNLGGWIHGPGIERALNAAQGPEGELAWTDFHLFAPPFVGADRNEAQRLAQLLLSVFPAEATARLYLATGDNQYLEALRGFEVLDGLGESLLAFEGRLPADPGSLNLGIGFSGAPGYGIGAGISFRHTNFGGWNTEFWLGGSTLGSGYASVRARSSKKLFASIDLGFSRGLLYRYVGDERESHWRTRLWAEGGPGFRRGPFRLWVNGVARTDDLGEGVLAGHGVLAGFSWDDRSGWGAGRRGVYLAAESESSLFGDYAHTGLFVDGRAFVGLLGGVLGARVTHQHAFNPEVPFFRLPVVGGFSLHRGAYYSRWRAPWISTVDLEERWMLFGPVEGVVFGNAAWVSDSGLHSAAGLGFRLILPPEETNVSRVDIAFSDSGWGLYGAWGEAF